MQRLALSVVAVVSLGCPPSTTDGIGTLRGNQRKLFDGQGWQDPVCGPAETETESPINCCTRNDRLICPEFFDYDIVDVKVKGQRVAVLFQVNNGNSLLLSDDLGETWRTIGVGSVGGIATTQSMTILLAGDDVYLMVQTSVPVPLGFRTTARPYRVNLETAQTAWENVELFTRPYAFSEPDGTTYGVLFTPVDARNAGGPCMAQFEQWKPGGTVQRSQLMTGFSGCLIEMNVTASDDGRFFPYPMNDGARSCTLQYDRASNTLGSSCVAWGQWPPARAMQSQPIALASWAGKRALRLGAFTLEGNAWASPVAATDWISLGAGEVGRNLTLAGRQRYPGLVPITGKRLVRVNSDKTVDEAVFPTSPCEGERATCFDSNNSSTWHGEVGDVLWAEPLGDDEYLVFYAHDRVFGIDSYQPTFTASKEKFTWRRVDAIEPPSVLGPPGYPDAQEAGLLEKYCLLELSCGAPSFDFYACLGNSRTTSLQPGFDAAMNEVAGATCTSPILDDAYFDCKVRGGSYFPPDGGNDPFGICDFGVNLTGAQCGSCTGDVLLTCPGFPSPAKAVNCAAGGTTCASGGCRPATPCTEGSSACVGDVGVTCFQGQESRVRCDLLNMSCDRGQPVPAWSPCIGKGNWQPSQTNQPLRCEGQWVMWHINGDKWADCTALGFSGCAGGRCTP